MKAKMKANRNSKPYKVNKRHMPVKTSINLAAYGKKTTNPLYPTAGIAIILLLAIIFSKVAVMDRLNTLYKAQAQVEILEADLAEKYKIIEEGNEISREYAHYTYSQMTELELATVKETKVIDLLDKYVLKKTKVENFSVSENVIILPITGLNLKEINTIVEELQSDDMVSYCTVNTATTNENGEISLPSNHTSGSKVTAQVTIYLNSSNDWNYMKEGEQE